MSTLTAEQPAHPNPSGRPQWVITALLLIGYLAFSVLVPLPRFDFDHVPRAGQALLVLIPTSLFMLLQLSISISLVRLRLNVRATTIAAVVILLLWLIALLPIPLHNPGYWKFTLIFLTHLAVKSILLSSSLTFFGILLSQIIKERNLLLPVALIAMPIDYVGAMTPTGFTHDMVKHIPNFVQSVSVSVPKITSTTVHGVSLGPIAFIGPGDVLFLAFYFACVLRFDLDQSKTFWWMYVLLTVSMLIVVTLPFFPIGALVPMGIAVIAANYREIKLKRAEAFAVLYAGLLILAIVGLFFFLSHRYLFHSH